MDYLGNYLGDEPNGYCGTYFAGYTVSVTVGYVGEYISAYVGEYLGETIVVAPSGSAGGGARVEVARIMRRSGRLFREGGRLRRQVVGAGPCCEDVDVTEAVCEASMLGFFFAYAYERRNTVYPCEHGDHASLASGPTNFAFGGGRYVCRHPGSTPYGDPATMSAYTVSQILQDGGTMVTYGTPDGPIVTPLIRTSSEVVMRVYRTESETVFTGSKSRLVCPVTIATDDLVHGTPPFIYPSNCCYESPTPPPNEFNWRASADVSRSPYAGGVAWWNLDNGPLPTGAAALELLRQAAVVVANETYTVRLARVLTNAEMRAINLRTLDPPLLPSDASLLQLSFSVTSKIPIAATFWGGEYNHDLASQGVDWFSGAPQSFQDVSVEHLMSLRFRCFRPWETSGGTFGRQNTDPSCLNYTTLDPPNQSQTQPQTGEASFRLQVVLG